MGGTNTTDRFDGRRYPQGIGHVFFRICSCEEYERDEIKRVMSRMISVGDSIMTKNNVIVPKEDAAVSCSFEPVMRVWGIL